jgi:hypothetical protein
LAYRMNKMLSLYCQRWSDLCDEQNDLMKRLNHEWYNAYMRLVELKTEAKHE